MLFYKSKLNSADSTALFDCYAKYIQSGGLSSYVILLRDLFNICYEYKVNVPQKQNITKIVIIPPISVLKNRDLPFSLCTQWPKCKPCVNPNISTCLNN